MNPKCLDSFLTVKEAAQAIGWTRQGIRKQIKSKRLKGIKKGNDWFILKSDWRAFEREVRRAA